MDNVEQWRARRERIGLDGVADTLTSDQLNPGTISGQAFREEMSAAIASGGEAVEITWSEVTGKPSTFPPETHTHGWSEVTGRPSTFPPETHTHDVADVTGLQAIIDDLTARIVALEGGTP